MFHSVWDFFISWTMRPRMMCPLDNATLGRRISWTMRPLEDVSLTDVSRPLGQTDLMLG
jgi:hypothetical protein